MRCNKMLEEDVDVTKSLCYTKSMCTGERRCTIATICTNAIKRYMQC